LGYQPDLVVNGHEALAALDRQPYDLIFMDMMMPQMDGLEATRLIRSRQQAGAAHPNYQSRIIIIAMTAHAMQSDRKKCLAAGMDDYLAKPVRPEDIRDVIERWGTTINSPPAAAPAAPAAAPAATETPPAPPATEEPPIDMERLKELSGGSQECMRELIEFFLKQTAEQLAQLEAAARAGRAEEVRQVSHSCVGACATLGVTSLVPLLRELERKGASQSLTHAVQLCDDAAREFKLIQDFLAPHLPETTEPATLSCP
jgi:CheY-like chemotaxis protein